MPYANVSGFKKFPVMSRHHCNLISILSDLKLKNMNIFETVQKKYVAIYQIIKKTYGTFIQNRKDLENIIISKISNIFLEFSDIIHCGTQKDFMAIV